MVIKKTGIKKRRLKGKPRIKKSIPANMMEESIPDMPIDNEPKEKVVLDMYGNPRVNWLLEDRDTNQYFAKKFTTEDCLKFMKQGASMLKYCSPGKDPHYRRFRLSDSETHLIWCAPNSVKDEKKVAVGDLVKIIEGQHTEKFAAYSANVDKSETSLSIIYSGTKSIDVICGDKRDYYVFLRGLQFLIDRYKLIQKRIEKRSKKVKMVPLNKPLEFELTLAFKKYNIAPYGKPMYMPSKKFKTILKDLNLKYDGFDLLQLCQEADPMGEGVVHFDKYFHMMQKIISQSASIDEIVEAFKVLARSNKDQLIEKEVMRDHFINFIKSSISPTEVDDWLAEVPTENGKINYNQLAYILSGQ